jgi:hypothetical protein
MLPQVVSPLVTAFSKVVQLTLAEQFTSQQINTPQSTVLPFSIAPHRIFGPQTKTVVRVI